MSKNNKVTKRLWKLFKCYYFECHAIILSNDPSNWFLPNFPVMGGTGMYGGDGGLGRSLIGVGGAAALQGPR